MRTIAVLDSSVRLVVFQFLMKSALVPAIIPSKRISKAPPLPTVSGVEVLKSTPRVGLATLAGNIAFGENYEIVDVWKKPHETNWNTSFVRFVFCHKEHVRRDELFPSFVAQKKELERIFVEMVSNNLWATQCHLNPYFEKDGDPSGLVLMFGCAGRVPNTEVFQGGRDENNRGVGPKVLLSVLSPYLVLTIANWVVLADPDPIPETVPAPAV